MPGISVAPSTGFWDKLKNSWPQMLNTVGQNYGGSFSGAAKMTGNMMSDRMNARRDRGTMDNSTMPRATMQPSMGDNSGMSPTPAGGMVRMPSFAPMINSGAQIGGGMFNSLPMPRTMGPMSPMGNDNGTGLWNTYNNLSQQIGGPNRRPQLYG